MGLVWSIIQITREAFPAAPTYGVADIPDLSGKVMIVTGGYAGEITTDFSHRL